MSEKDDIFAEFSDPATLLGKLYKKRNLIGMTDERYRELWNTPSLSLSKEEIKIGWHWCNEFDGLLVGPGMEEFEEMCKPNNCIKL